MERLIAPADQNGRSLACLPYNGREFVSQSNNPAHPYDGLDPDCFSFTYTNTGNNQVKNNQSATLTVQYFWR